MQHYFRKNGNNYDEINVDSLKGDEFERLKLAKKMADIIITSENEETIQKILNGDSSIDTVEITCYNDTDVMERKEALDFYSECMSWSEGAERDRYYNIYFGLKAGKKKVHD